MNVTFCRFCFTARTLCDCHPRVSSAPAPSQNTPRHSYAAKTTVASTTGSTSNVGVPTAAGPSAGYTMVPPSRVGGLPSNTASLLAGASVGRGTIMQRMLSRPPGLCQVRPQSTPYQQQVPAPRVPRHDMGTRPVWLQRPPRSVLPPVLPPVLPQAWRLILEGDPEKGPQSENLGMNPLSEEDPGPLLED